MFFRARLSSILDVIISGYGHPIENVACRLLSYVDTSKCPNDANTLQRRNRDAKDNLPVVVSQELVDLYKQDKSFCSSIFVEKKNVVYLTEVVIP